MLGKIRTRGYFELRKDAMPDPIKRVVKVLKEDHYVIENPTKLRIPSPVLPRTRSPAMIRRLGNEFPEIISGSYILADAKYRHVAVG